MAMISAPEIFVSSCLWSWRAEPRPVAVRPRRMKIAEKLATKRRLGPSTRRQPALVELARRDAGHRREVAGHQRQHAGGEEGDDPGREGGEDPDPGRGIGS